MLDKLKNIFNGKTGKWNRTNNFVVQEMFEKLKDFNEVSQIIFKHSLVSTDLFSSDLFGINNNEPIFYLSTKDRIQFKKFYSVIISFYVYNISLNNKSIAETLLKDLLMFCLEDDSVKETIKIFNKFSKVEKTELSKVGFKVLEKVSQIFNERLTAANEIISLQRLILYYDLALKSIHSSLKTT